MSSRRQDEVKKAGTGNQVSMSIPSAAPRQNSTDFSILHDSAIPRNVKRGMALNQSMVYWYHNEKNSIEFTGVYPLEESHPKFVCQGRPR